MFSLPEDGKSAVKGLREVNVKDKFYLEVKGISSQSFVAIIQSEDNSYQLAPIDKFKYDTNLLGKNKLRRYPPESGIGFKEEYGLGWRRIIIIKSSVIPRYSASIDGGSQITPAELNALALYYLTNDFSYHIHVHEFTLVSKI